MSLLLRYMRLPDIPVVITIDRLSFDPPWSARSYAYEVSEANYSHMLVLEQADDEKPATGLMRLLRSLSGPRETEKRIVGYGGLWNLMDEAHISTIATHPDYRGRGWGEVLLAGMVRRSINLGAAYVVLEVRVSNTPAQNLYKKYEFETVGVKPRYYHNNGEDAYDMRLNLNDPALIARFQERFAALQAKHGFIDEYSASRPARG